MCFEWKANSAGDTDAGLKWEVDALINATEIIMVIYIDSEINKKVTLPHC